MLSILTCLLVGRKNSRISAPGGVHSDDNVSAGLSSDGFPSKPQSEFDPESHSNSIPRFLIEIYAGKVVSLAWEPPDSGENGYDVPENIAAGLISSALPGLPGLAVQALDPDPASAVYTHTWDCYI